MEIYSGARHDCGDESSVVIDDQLPADCSVRAPQNNPTPRSGSMKVPLNLDERHIEISNWTAKALRFSLRKKRRRR